jgi:hypothetical protein
MTVIDITLLVFASLELSNVFMLYFFPQTKKGNGVGVFNALHKSQNIPDVNDFVKYLINWVAGSKLIFIGLLIVIIFNGNTETKLYSLLILVLSISTFFWKLYPLIKKMDQNNQITPKGYSKTLLWMIISFMVIFLVEFIYFLV